MQARSPLKTVGMIRQEMARQHRPCPALGVCGRSSYIRRIGAAKPRRDSQPYSPNTSFPQPEAVMESKSPVAERGRRKSP